ncbi:MAG TPA: HAMP domain-containing sensor histidine kinase [Candidatus Limnocylindrales bacterium]|nr:HAMP domain-containing sensor histidine kinase [Candidatus Limnocylindrales bacterium]
MRGIRTRLTVTLLALVAVTVTSIGVGTYAFVEARLRDNLLAEASRQAQFDLSVLLPGKLPPDATQADFVASGLPAAFALRGDADLIVDFGDGDPFVAPTSMLAVFQSLPAELRATVDAGRLGYAWFRTSEGRGLIVGGRQAGGPAVYLVVDAEPLEAVLGQLRLGLVAAGLIAIVVAVAMAGLIARRILRPIASGSAAAARIAAGDLGARLRVEGRDEFAAWAREFNRMADSLQATVARLEAAQGQNRRFVADVSHELRTPLTALVAEASMIEADLDHLDPDARRAAELLVGDIRRLRALVDDLMELSRFDAAAESLRLEPVDLGRVLGSVVAARLPEAVVTLPPDPVVVESDVRRLDRIVGNLLDNARVHAPGSPVEVTLALTEREATITVADRGPGVGEAALGHLFDRFYKADPSRAAAASTSGLGLAIAAEHATLLGGTLRATARPGGGLAFTLILPVTRSLPDGHGADTRQIDDTILSEPTSRSDP